MNTKRTILSLSILLLLIRVVNAQLVNVQFGDPYYGAITGPSAAVGIGPFDYWNLASPQGDPYTLSGLKDFTGSPTSITLRTEGSQAAASGPGFDNGYAHSSTGGGDFQIYLDLPAGTYTLHVFNTLMYPTTFTLSMDGNEIDSETIYYNWCNWTVTLLSDDTLTINCSSGLEPLCNGIQIEGQTYPCVSPASYPTITWTGHPTYRAAVQDTSRREIWLGDSTGAQIISTDLNSPVGYLSMDVGGNPGFTAAQSVDAVLELLDPNCYGCNEATMSFWSMSTKLKTGSVGLGMHSIDATFGAGYSQARKEAYVPGAVYLAPYIPTAQIATVDCVNKISSVLTLTGDNFLFGPCVFADNADKLLIEVNGGSPSFYYFDPANQSLTSSSLSFGQLQGRMFYVPQLGVIVLTGSDNHTYVVNPTNDSILADLGDIGSVGCSGKPTGACYNSCDGLLYLAVQTCSTRYIKKFDPTNGYSSSGSVGDATGAIGGLFFDPYSNLVYEQRGSESTVPTY